MDIMIIGGLREAKLRHSIRREIVFLLIPHNKSEKENGKAEFWRRATRRTAQHAPRWLEHQLHVHVCST